MDARKEGHLQSVGKGKHTIGKPRLSLAGPLSQQLLLQSVSSVTDPKSREVPGTGLSHLNLYGRPCVGLQPHSDQLFPEIYAERGSRPNHLSPKGTQPPEMLTDLLPFPGISQLPSSTLPGYGRR